MNNTREQHSNVSRRFGKRPLLSRIALSGALLLVGSVAARADTLQDLLNGGTILVPTAIPGTSLLFSNFTSYTIGQSGGADVPLASEIFVTPTLAGTDHAGLRWQSAKWNVDPGQTMDTAWEYDVSVVGTAQITGAELHFVAHAETADAADHISQTLTNPALGIDKSMLLDSLTSLNSTAATITPPTSFLHVAKDVGLEGHTGQSAISTFDQHFDLTPTPEPGTYAMFFGMGVTGSVITLRRIRRRRK